MLQQIQFIPRELTLYAVVVLPQTVWLYTLQQPVFRGMRAQHGILEMVLSLGLGPDLKARQTETYGSRSSSLHPWVSEEVHQPLN